MDDTPHDTARRAHLCLAAGLIFAAAGGAAKGETASPAPAAPRSYSPSVLPGRGLEQHDFFYLGEWDTRKPVQTMFIVRAGKVAWSYSIPNHDANGVLQELDDATLLPDGNVLFARKTGAGIVTPDKRIVWSYDAPAGTEVHIAQPAGSDRVLIVENGSPAVVKFVSVLTGSVEAQFPIPVGNPKSPHSQFRSVRMTPAGTVLAAHMDNGLVAEYDVLGKRIWSAPVASPWAAIRLPNGNTLVSSNKGFVREIDPRGKSVWEYGRSDAAAAGITLFICQGVRRLSNGNTLIANWCPNGVKDRDRWSETVQVLEVTPEKKIVWALRSWKEPADLGPASTIELLGAP